MGKGKVSTINGVKALFCHDGCRDSFREDRRLGLIYGSVVVEGVLSSWETASILTNTCAYCGHYAPVKA